MPPVIHFAMQADFVKNLDKQFQASKAEQRLASSVSSSQGSKAAVAKHTTDSLMSNEDLLVRYPTLQYALGSSCYTLLVSEKNLIDVAFTVPAALSTA